MNSRHTVAVSIRPVCVALGLSILLTVCKRADVSVETAGVQAESSVIDAATDQIWDTTTPGWRPVASPGHYTGLIDSLAFNDSVGVFGDPIDLLPYRGPLGETADSNFTLDVALLTPVVEVGESPLLVVAVQTEDDSVRFEDKCSYTYMVLDESGELVDPSVLDPGLYSGCESWLVVPPWTVLAHLQDLSCIVSLYSPGRISETPQPDRRADPGVADPTKYGCRYGYELPVGTYSVVVRYARSVARIGWVRRESGEPDLRRTELGTVLRADTVQLRVVRRRDEAERLERLVALSQGLSGSLRDLMASVFAHVLVEGRQRLSLTASPAARILAVDGSPHIMVSLINMGLPTAIQNEGLNWHVGDWAGTGEEGEPTRSSSERLKGWLLLPHRSFIGQLVNARCPMLPNRADVAVPCSKEALEPGEYVIPIRYQRTIFDEAGRPISVDLRDTVRFTVKR